MYSFSVVKKKSLPSLLLSFPPTTVEKPLIATIFKLGDVTGLTLSKVKLIFALEVPGTHDAVKIYA